MDVDTTAAAPVAAPAERPDALEMKARDSLALNSRSLAERVRSPIVIASPDPAVRWRVLLGAVELSRTGGAQWISVALPGAASADVVTAGNAPDGQTCWLVGRGGLVLRSIDGAAFVRAPFPVGVDLVGIRAEGAQRATVTTADGRLFDTTDGGTNWTSR